MKIISCKLPSFALAALFAAASPAAVWAQAASYPDRPVKLVIPYPPGGPLDAIARTVGEQLGKRLGQPVVIENRAGATGSIGTQYVAKAAPDGYTLLLATSDSQVNNTLTIKHLSYEPDRDFAFITKIAESGAVMLVNTSLKTQNFKEFVALARSRSTGSLSYGSWGLGSFTHLLGATLDKQTGLALTHVPYKGAAPALTDLMGNQITVAFGPANVARQLAAAGKLVPLAITGTKRSVLLPDVPTFVEQGIVGPISTARVWIGALAPAATPSPILQRLYTDFQQTLQTPSVAAFINEAGFEVTPSTSAQFADSVRGELIAARKIAAEIGIEAE